VAFLLLIEIEQLIPSASLRVGMTGGKARQSNCKGKCNCRSLRDDKQKSKGKGKGKDKCKCKNNCNCKS
jgi:hypothetical protein